MTVKTRPIRVTIDHGKFWNLAQRHPVHMNISVFKELRDAGIPVDGGIELRGVTRGKLTCWNEHRNGKRYCVYEWADEEPEDDEL